MEDGGFADVTEKMVKVPIGQWTVALPSRDRWFGAATYERIGRGPLAGTFYTYFWLQLRSGEHVIRDGMQRDKRSLSTFIYSVQILCWEETAGCVIRNVIPFFCVPTTVYEGLDKSFYDHLSVYSWTEQRFCITPSLVS
jgi:hypothetical protein